MDRLLTYLAGAALCTLAIYGIRAATRVSRLPLPPGPRGLPVIGNLLDLPTKESGLQGKYLHELGLQHGPVASITVLGEPWIVINDHDVAQELFTKRAANYNDRQPNAMLDLVEEAGWPRISVMADYDAYYRLQHRSLASGMTAVHAPRWRAVFDLEGTQLLRDVLLDCDASGDVQSRAFIQHVQRAQASSMFGLFFGARMPQLDSPMFHHYKHVMAAGSVSLLPHKTALDFVPALKHMPRLLSPWRRRAEAVCMLEKEKLATMAAHAQQFPGWSLHSHVLGQGTRNGLSADMVTHLTTNAAFAGIETSPPSIMWFMVAALGAANEGSGVSWVHTARAALDAVVGHERLPGFEDRAALPIVEAIMRETFRWRPMLPSGMAAIAHRAASDDEFRGMRIPGGALMFANAWGIARHAPLFGPDGDAFVPERWFTDRDVHNGTLRTDLPTPIFGYGRRRCWGYRVAEDGVWLFMARLLWAFDIVPVHHVTMSMDLFGACAPLPSHMRLVPRGPWVEQVVDKVFQGAEKELVNVLKV